MASSENKIAAQHTFSNQKTANPFKKDKDTTSIRKIQHCCGITSISNRFHLHFLSKIPNKAIILILVIFPHHAFLTKILLDLLA